MYTETGHLLRGDHSAVIVTALIIAKNDNRSSIQEDTMLRRTLISAALATAMAIGISSPAQAQTEIQWWHAMPARSASG